MTGYPWIPYFLSRITDPDWDEEEANIEAAVCYHQKYNYPIESVVFTLKENTFDQQQDREFCEEHSYAVDRVAVVGPLKAIASISVRTFHSDRCGSSWVQCIRGDCI